MNRLIPWLLLLTVAGCMEGTKAAPLKRQPSLYTRLGGEPKISKVVDDFVANMILSPKIRQQHKEHFLKGDVATLKRKLIDQIGEASGGPEHYTGKSMKLAHEGMGLTNADFNATVEALSKALDQNDVPKKEKDELLALLAPMKADVVEVKAP